MRASAGDRFRAAPRTFKDIIVNKVYVAVAARGHQVRQPPAVAEAPVGSGSGVNIMLPADRLTRIHCAL
jgi:hypothetical protein